MAEYEDDEFTEDEDLEEFDDEEVEEVEEADVSRKAKSRDAKEEGDEEDVDPIADLLFDVLDILDLDAEIELEEREDHVRYHIEGQDLGVLIGRHGQTLEALQFLVGVINARKQLVDYRVIIDVEGYRDRREKQLRDLARRKAQQACREGKRIVLDPMPPVDRRIIHMALANSTSVKTYSEGEEPERCVVIAPGDQD